MPSPLHVKRRISRATAVALDTMFQSLEPRLMLSVASTSTASSLFTAETNYEVDGSPASNEPASSSSVVGNTPAKITHAYDLDSLTFSTPNGTITGNGAGQTIGIIDAYNDPRMYSSSDATDYANSDLAKFCTQFNLPQFGSGGPTFSKVNETGGTSYPQSDQGWSTEIALDVEWAHAIAPEANIMLVECNNSDSDLLDSGVTYAANHGCSVISMSFTLTDSNNHPIDTTQYENDFTHSGVTYCAATGDTGTPSASPADSPNVLAVGGTVLTLNSDNTWSAESGWSGSGGGYATAFTKPSYQNGITSVSDPNNMRMAPDVAFDASPASGVAIYDSYGEGTSSKPWSSVGGTSLATPCWAAMIAIADQDRVANGLSTLDAVTTHNTLYSLPSSDFHDETSGNNGHGSVAGYSAGPGYDLVTGLGSPVANLLIPDLSGVPNAPPAPSSLTLSASSDSGVSNSDRITNVNTPTITGSAKAGSTVRLYENSILIGQGTADANTGVFSIVTNPLADGTYNITATATNSAGTSPASGSISITIDTVGPTIGAISFNPNQNPMTITIPFSENVSMTRQSLSISGLTYLAQSESFNTSTDVATFTFGGWSQHGYIPDGTYTATVPAGTVTDLAGNSPANTSTLNFTFYQGDANGDGTINALDFNALASGYGKSGMNFSQGDFNYDGTVNSSDFAILASRFNTKVPAAADVPDGSQSAEASIAATPAATSIGATSPNTVFSDQPVSDNLAADVLS